uniref:Tetratricopeptide repeat-containing protein n=1 Tax=Candidatus Kentrum sp. SD TaxID=2126332 RepID=A0A450Z7P2_9GAMM|nr:MAG: Tetratricopeptide repeat-containing protein [Candidatus Kentron sp. SD]VFK49821.1 MAG: Tetratricopeptide repeat-containing protein [Candidatus Kentron sp. SD]
MFAQSLGIFVFPIHEPSAKNERDAVKRHGAALRTGLADVLADQGKYAEARAQYGLALETAEELNDLRQQGTILAQLGTLALMEGDIADAVGRYQEALKWFQRLGEPAEPAAEAEAGIQHQLGRAFQQARQWEPAERHYRASARLSEQGGDLATAAQTWNGLAVLNQSAGRIDAAERWYRKAMDGGRQTGDTLPTARALNNLADLLQSQPGRLDEARRLAEEALDPGAAEIWKTYELLAQIADRQSRPDEAAEYRRLARDAKRGFRCWELSG